MEVTKADIAAIDTLLFALKKSEFNRIQGEECLSLALACNKIMSLRARIQKKLDEPSEARPIKE